MASNGGRHAEWANHSSIWVGNLRTSLSLSRPVPPVLIPDPASMSPIPSQQKALFLESKLGQFAVRTTDVGKAGPGELLVKVEATALNPFDWKVQAYGAFDMVDTYPTVLGWDMAGTVVGIGEGVRAFAVGDRV